MRNSTRWHNDQLSTLLLLSVSIWKCHIVQKTCSEVASSESSVFYKYINLNPGPVYWINIFVRTAEPQRILHQLIHTQNFANFCETGVHWTVHKSLFAHTHSSRLRTMLMLPSSFTVHHQTVNTPNSLSLTLSILKYSTQDLLNIIRDKAARGPGSSVGIATD